MKIALSIGLFIVGVAGISYLLIDTQMFDLKQVQSAQVCSHAQGMVLVEGGAFTMGAGAVYPEEMPL
jgi:formylglycine-generating enzyme required for sulfatase activity